MYFSDCSCFFTVKCIIQLFTFSNCTCITAQLTFTLFYYYLFFIIIVIAFFFIFHMLPFEFALFSIFWSYIFVFTFLAFCGQRRKNLIEQGNMFPNCPYDIKNVT